MSLLTFPLNSAGTIHTVSSNIELFTDSCIKVVCCDSKAISRGLSKWRHHDVSEQDKVAVEVVTKRRIIFKLHGRLSLIALTRCFCTRRYLRLITRLLWNPIGKRGRPKTRWGANIVKFLNNMMMMMVATTTMMITRLLLILGCVLIPQKYMSFSIWLESHDKLINFV